MHRPAQKRAGHREKRKRPKELPGEMTRAPELERAHARDQDVQDQRSRSDGSGSESGQTHHGDVTGCTGVAHGRIEKRDHEDAEEEQGKRAGRHGPKEETSNLERSTSNVAPKTTPRASNLSAFDVQHSTLDVIFEMAATT